VLNVTASDERPDRVELQFELDGLDVERLPNHADRVDLTPEQARTVAAALTRYADRIERTRAETPTPTDGADAERASRTATRSFKPARGYRRP